MGTTLALARRIGCLVLLAQGLTACNLQSVTRGTDQSDTYSSLSAGMDAHFGALENEDGLATPASRKADAAIAKLTPAVPDFPLPADSAWDRMRADFQLPDADDPRLDSHIAWFKNNPDYLERVFERADPYLVWILEELDKHGLPADLALLPVVESSFQPYAYSPGRAAGLWQFIPGTGERFGLKQNWWYDGRRDVVASTGAAISYLKYLHNYFDGDWLLALAAYNSGEGTVANAVRRNARAGKPTDFWNLDLPRETRDYVPKLIALRDIIADPDRHGLQLRDIGTEIQIEPVDTAGQIDLALAADMADISLEDLYRLNPGYNRWATDPDGPHRLLLPSSSVNKFLAELAGLTDEDRVSWERHKVQRGETLSQIAQRYDTSVELLRSTNGLRGSAIRSGDHLLIPVARQELADYSLTATQREQRRLARKTGQGAQTYTVKTGDTLWDIARANKLSVQKLARLNGMAPRDRLRNGRILIVSEGGNTDLRATPLPRHATRQTVHYTVRRGDSLARISQRFQVSVSDLRKWNSLQEDRYLKPGQRLKMYVDVTQQADNG